MCRSIDINAIARPPLTKWLMLIDGYLFFQLKLVCKTIGGWAMEVLMGKRGLKRFMEALSEKDSIRRLLVVLVLMGGALPAWAADPSPPTNPTATAGNSAVQVSFYTPNPRDSSIDHFLVTASNSSETCTVPAPSIGAVPLSCIVRGLTNSTPYTFTVYSVTAGGTQSTATPSQEVQATPQDSYPAIPQNVKGLASDGQAIISWDAVTDSTDSITAYQVWNGATQVDCPTPASNSPQCTAKNLSNGTSYSFTVTASDSKSNQSLPSLPVTVTPSASVPSAPTNVTATTVSTASQVTVSWTAPTPAPTPTHPVTSYQVQPYAVTVDSKGNVTNSVAQGNPITINPPSTTTTINIEPEDIGTAYQYQVSAFNQDGISLPSSLGPATPVIPWAVSTYSIQGLSKLPKGKVAYVTGFSTDPPYVLQKDGTWATPSESIAVLPCYPLGPNESMQSITADSRQAGISARVYFFVVDKEVACNPTTSGYGLFNVENVFTASASVKNSVLTFSVTEPTVPMVLNGNVPAWTFAEIGGSASRGTLDLSQVDFFAFPMNAAATVEDTTTNPGAVGNPVGSVDNPDDVVNTANIRDRYSRYMNDLARAGNSKGGCSEDSTPVPCAFLNLLQLTNTTLGGPSQIILNPGAYLNQVDASGKPTKFSDPLNTLFDPLIQTLWSSSTTDLVINSGGAFGNIPQADFTATYVSTTYPGTNVTVGALQFTGANKTVYVYSPYDVAQSCHSDTNMAGCGDAKFGSGYQVFADGGTLAGCPAAEKCTSDENGLVSRLGLLISAAMNRGVADQLSCQDPTEQSKTTNTTNCWQDETRWYPTDTNNQYTTNATVQNLFSRWMHTGQISGTPIFVQPPKAVNSAGGNLMGMAYGFAADENPTPQVTTQPQPEVPSKMDQTILYGESNTITFGPWTTPSDQPTLTVSLQGQGTVTSSPAGINCGTGCSYAFTQGIPVNLTATPANGHVFSSWSGACTGSSTTCQVTMQSAKNVTAKFTAHPLGQFGLTVVVRGSGTVTGGGIDCPNTCSQGETANSNVTLKATPSQHMTFTGWSGACTGTSLTCKVTMSQAQTVHANFASASQYTLSVTSGTGGTVTTQPAGIDCGTVCQASFDSGTQVTVDADPAPGYVFISWSGACAGTQTCDLTMDGNQSLKATFAATPPQTYSLTVHDAGSGTVTSTPAGINCGSACSSAFTADTPVSLTATPASGYYFSGWSGACSGSGACVVDMDQKASVTANFKSSTPATFVVSGTVNLPVSGGTGGTVTLALTPNAGNHGSPTQTVTQTVSSGAFSFSNLDNGRYTLSIVGLSSQKLACAFANQSLSAPPITLAVNNSTGNNVTCALAAKGYSVGGSVSGLDSGKTVSLRNNGGANQGGSTLSVSNPGPQEFLFPLQVANTSGYAVTVKTQPPGQDCVVSSNGKGSTANHKNSLAVGVSCQKKPAAYSVGGTVTGLPDRTTLTLLDNGSDSMIVSGAGNGTQGIPFTFGTEISNGAAYNVSVGQQPLGFQCDFSNQSGSGTVSGSDVNSVAVVCNPNPSMFSISGTASGLASGQSVTLQEGNFPPQVLTPGNNTYAFYGLNAGLSYSLALSSKTATCQFDGPDPSSGMISSWNVEVNLVCKNPTNTFALTVQNTGLQSAFLLNRNQAAVVQLNGDETASVWGGATGATVLGTFPAGFDFNVQAIGQSKGEQCDQFNNNTDNVTFQCVNVGPGAQPGECAGLYNNTSNQSMPPANSGDLCQLGSTSGAVKLADGRWKWRCSGSGNPKVLHTGAGDQWQGTSTCYTTSYSTPNPGKQNQNPLWINPSSWSLSAGGSQTFTIQGGSGTGDVYAPNVESVGHATCSVQTRVNNPGYRVVATKSPGTNGNGACVVWVRKMGDANYYDVDASPAVFNVKSQ